MAVVGFHFNPAWLPGGFVGVDVFLVVSGYLIAGILLNKKAQTDSPISKTLRQFYISRLKRIAPAYFFMLALVSLATAFLFLPADLDVFKRSLLKAAYFNSNNYFSDFGDYFGPGSHEQPLLHTWSLAVEIQFYLLAPILILGLPPRLLKWSLVTLVIGLTALSEYRLSVLGIEQATYYSLYARLPEFFAGCLVALHIRSAQWRTKPWLGVLGILLIICSAIGQPHLGHFPGGPALLPVIATTLVLAQPVQGRIGQWLTCAPMIRLGELSYSLYLWHWPVLALLRYYTGCEVLSLSHSLLFVAITLLLATLSFYWVETPLRARGAARKLLLAYGVLALSVLVIGKGIGSLNQLVSPAQLPVTYQRYADPATICHGQIVGDCFRGDLSSQKEVLVLGDSHAAMLNHFFENLGKGLGFKARIITASSCVTIPGFDYNRIDEWSRAPCLAQIESVRAPIRNASVIFIAAHWVWQFESKEFQAALEGFLLEQTRAGKKIYLLGQEPLLVQNPMRALHFKAIGLPYEVTISAKYRSANAKLKKYASHYAGVTYLNFEQTGFFDEAPFYHGELIYFDNHHLNAFGAERYGEVARDDFRKIVD